MFQVESRAQMASLPRNRPEKFYDLVVQVAIIRPGPIVGKMMHPYMRRRQKQEKVTYPHPSLEQALKRTLGVPLFQEQLLRMAMVVANFTGSEAEELRRAVGMRRSWERMKNLEGRLRAGMTTNGLDETTQETIIQNITSFALYGFPESHAASFALIAYASAYVKVKYLAAFTCAMLNNQPMGFYSPSVIIEDARRHGLRVKPIDVQVSQWSCSIEHEADHTLSLRLGLGYVRGLRKVYAEIGAGPKARHARTRYEHDEDYERAEAARLYMKSGEPDFYLGDWHTHPGGRGRMSRQDRKTMANMAASGETITRPVTIVLEDPGWVVCAWQFVRRNFITLAITKRLSVKTY